MKTGSSESPLESVVSSKGQVVLPARLRLAHQIEEGTRIRFIDTGTEIKLVPITESSISQIRGIAKHPSLPRDIERDPDREVK